MTAIILLIKMVVRSGRWDIQNFCATISMCDDVSIQFIRCIVWSAFPDSHFGCPWGPQRVSCPLGRKRSAV